jgi:hypothetical protein
VLLASLLAGLRPAWSAATDSTVLYQEAFDRVSSQTGLPEGWSAGPTAHVPWVLTAPDSSVFASSPRSLRVDLPLAPLNFQIRTPFIPIPDVNGSYTAEFSLRVEEPDASMRVQAVVCGTHQGWLEVIPLLDLTGARMDAFRRFRVSFRHRDVTASGYCFLMFGLPYRKLLREGRFWVDDVTLGTGEQAPALQLYLTPTTVAAGDRVGVHLSCGQGSATLRVFREGVEREPVLGPITLDGLSEHPMPEQAYRLGCNWPQAAEIPTGTDWTSGLYVAQVDDGNRPVDASFVVRGRGGEGPILVVIPNHTDQAYNDAGGGSFYSHPRATEICFERPFAAWMDGIYAAPIRLIRWLEREGIGYGTATDDDLNDRPELLYKYPGVVLCWHSEYWTRLMREHLADYVGAGGSLLCFSGNTCWWQTRLEDPPDSLGRPMPRRLVCYKGDAGRDPSRWTDPALVTTNWDLPPLQEPQQSLFGLNYRQGGMVNWATGSECPCPFDWLLGHGGYQAFHTDSWVFAGTGVTEGETLGRDQAIVGYEVDGANLVWKNGRPEPAPGFGSPAGFEILGYAPCYSLESADSAGVAIMGLVDRGRSFTFNGGTTGWCWGLAADPVIQRITKNLIARLSPGSPSPHAPGLVLSSNPVTSTLSIRFSGEIPPQVGVYAADGRQFALLHPRFYGPSTAHVVWNLHDQEGRPAPSGVYLIRVPGAAPVRVVCVR